MWGETGYKEEHDADTDVAEDDAHLLAERKHEKLVRYERHDSSSSSNSSCKSKLSIFLAKTFFIKFSLLIEAEAAMAS